ncbi:MAG TPA: 2-C-methyl-D-erythritol 2,4-cyclodiphosphate synthase [Leucothrix mucor]|nr:2-C-methyl-D-erythritol 2,4-cyclodiphosphate synthase [Leucothrix mucor]
MFDMRIGNGFDVHTFTSGDHIVLGGVKIPYSQSFKAHSDGDVLLHAICDALLGALALGDIGKHFPDTSKQFKNIDSRILLRKVYALILEQQYILQNMDCIIVAQSPKMSPHIISMRENISVDLGVNTDQISVKATTTECLGFEGRGEGISAQVVLILIRKSMDNNISD